MFCDGALCVAASFVSFVLDSKCDPFRLGPSAALNFFPRVLIPQCKAKPKIF